MPPLSRETDRFAKKSNVGHNIIPIFNKPQMVTKQQIWSKSSIIDNITDYIQDGRSVVLDSRDRGYF